MTEWKRIPGFPDYEISDDGRIWSLLRNRELHPVLNGPYRQIRLKPEGGGRRAVMVARQVLSAFVGPPPDGHEACHRNGVSTDNRLSNLYWGTHAENMLDQVRHGTHPHASKGSCPKGHQYTSENTRLYRGRRHCRSCNRNRMREYRKGVKQ